MNGINSENLFLLAIQGTDKRLEAAAQVLQSAYTAHPALFVSMALLVVGTTVLRFTLEV
jgi:hypothetical protein